jgi:hypothetical protein
MAALEKTVQCSMFKVQCSNSKDLNLEPGTLNLPISDDLQPARKTIVTAKTQRTRRKPETKGFNT